MSMIYECNRTLIKDENVEIKPNSFPFQSLVGLLVTGSSSSKSKFFFHGLRTVFCFIPLKGHLVTYPYSSLHIFDFFP